MRRASAAFAQQMANGGRYAASKAGVEFQVSGPPGVAGPAEVKLPQDLGRTAADGIAVENLAPELFVADLVKQDRRLAAVDTVPLEGSGVTTYVGNDNEAIGRAFADKLDSYNLAKIKKYSGGDYLTAGFDLNEATLRAVEEGVNVDEVIARQESGEARDKWFAPRLDEFFADLGGLTRPLGEAS